MQINSSSNFGRSPSVVPLNNGANFFLKTIVKFLAFGVVAGYKKDPLISRVTNPYQNPQSANLGALAKTLICHTFDAMHIPSSCPSSDVCITQNQAWLELSASEGIETKNSSVKSDGNKGHNLQKMSLFIKRDNLEDLIDVPKSSSILNDDVHRFLLAFAPKVFEEWNKFKEMDFTPSFEEDPRVDLILKTIENEILSAFSRDDFTSFFSKEHLQWFEELKKKDIYLMVRSSGAEDSDKLANAGGNKSKSYVEPTPAKISVAIGEVIASYFSKTSLQNRLLAESIPWKEDLALAVTLQELVGERVNGESDPTKIPVSFVLFTNEPTFVGDEEFRVMTLNAAYGHGDWVVGSKGPTDRWLIVQSVSHPDQIYCLPNIQNKEKRLTPMRKEGEIDLKELDVPFGLQKKPSLNPEQLVRTYFSGSIIEGFFKHATDIEGVWKDGKLHVVQARPIKREPLVPTYLSKPSYHPIQGEVLSLGKGAVLKITNPSQILFSDFLEETLNSSVPENNLDIKKHQLVLVQNPEAQNSHAVVNYLGLGIPAIYLDPSDKLEIQRKSNSLNQNSFLVVCMQTGSLHFWDESRDGKLDDFIKKGFGVHPAQIAISLETPSEIRLRRSFDSKGFKALLNQLKKEENPNNILEEIQSQDLIKKLVSFNHPMALELHQKILRSIEEIRASTSKGRLEKLLHIKVLETLLLGPGQSSQNRVGEFSVMDLPSLLKSEERIEAYRKKLSHSPHCLDLLVLGVQSHQEAFESWERFLIEIENLIQNHSISIEKIKGLKKYIKSLSDTRTLSFWFTFFQEQHFSSPLKRLDAILEQTRFFKMPVITSWVRSAEEFYNEETFNSHRVEIPKWKIFQSEITKYIPTIFLSRQDSVELLETLRKEQLDLLRLREEIYMFCKAKTLEPAWKSLQLHVARYTSIEWKNLIEVAPPPVKAAMIETMHLVLEDLDLACKAMKSSPDLPVSFRVSKLKEMLEPYVHLMKSYVGLIRHQLRSLKIFNTQNVDYLEYILRDCSNDNPQELGPSAGFSVSSSMLRPSEEMGRYEPKHLEDVLTLAHQNSLFALSILYQNMISSERLTHSLIPQEITDSIFRINTSKILDMQNAGITITDQELSINYNIPLRGHSSRIELIYKFDSEDVIIKGSLIGNNEEERWNFISFYLEALWLPEVILEAPFVGSQELTIRVQVKRDDVEKFVTDFYQISKNSNEITSIYGFVSYQLSLLPIAHLQNVVENVISRIEKGERAFNLKANLILPKHLIRSDLLFRLGVLALYSQDKIHQNIGKDTLKYLYLARKEFRQKIDEMLVTKTQKKQHRGDLSGDPAFSLFFELAREGYLQKELFDFLRDSQFESFDSKFVYLLIDSLNILFSEKYSSYFTSNLASKPKELDSLESNIEKLIENGLKSPTFQLKLKATELWVLLSGKKLFLEKEIIGFIKELNSENFDRLSQGILKIISILKEHGIDIDFQTLKESSIHNQELQEMND